MDLTTRALWTLVHGMCFGGLYLLACSGALMEIHALSRSSPAPEDKGARLLCGYLLVMAVLAWAAVLSGTYIIYPWYRAVAPSGAADLAGFPQRLLLSRPGTAAWHSFGMEWKEHVAWLAPMSITMATAVCWKYGRELRAQRQLRQAVLVFTFVSLLSAGAAAFFGAMLDKAAPVEGGAVVHLLNPK